MTEEQKKAISDIKASFASRGMNAEPKEKKPFRMFRKQHPVFGLPPLTPEGQEATMRYGLPAAASFVGSPATGMAVRGGINVLAGAAGEAGAQASEVSRGARDEMNLGEIGASGITNLAGGRFFKDAAIGGLAETARSYIDEGKIPEWKRLLLVSALSGGASKAVGKASEIAEKTSNSLGTRVLNEFDDLVKEREVIFKKMRQKGFKADKSAFEDQGVLNWIAGQSQVNKEISQNNQIAAQKLVRRVVGGKGSGSFRKEVRSDTGAIVDYGEIGDAIRENGEVYRKVEKYSEDLWNWTDKGGKHKIFDKLTPEDANLIADSGNIVSEIRSLRKQKGDAIKQIADGAPDGRENFLRLQAEERMLEQRVDRIAEAVGDETLLKDMKDARQQFAKLFVVKQIVDPTLGVVNPRAIVALDNVGVPLTGELRDLADFAKNFFDLSQHVTDSMRNAPANLSTRLGAVAIASGNPQAAAASFSMPFIGGPAKSIVKSPIYQRAAVGAASKSFGNPIAKGLSIGAMDQIRQPNEGSSMAEIMRQLGMGQ